VPYVAITGSDIGGVLLDELQHLIVDKDPGDDLQGIGVVNRTLINWILVAKCKGVDLVRFRKLNGALYKKGERAGDPSYLKHVSQYRLAISLCREHF
jgi:hypothetical protein